MSLFGSNKNKNNEKDSKVTRMKVRIVNIKGDIYICSHVGSNFKVEAKCKTNMNLEIGQIVMLEYNKKYSSSGYIVVDDLSEELEAEVLNAQHIIDGTTMYTSLILRNPKTNRRMHSLISSTNNLFSSSTCTILEGDKVKLKINNGNIFKIHNCSEEAELGKKDK